jgi:hypothetical protein
MDMEPFIIMMVQNMRVNSGMMRKMGKELCITLMELYTMDTGPMGCKMDMEKSKTPKILTSYKENGKWEKTLKFSSEF